MKNVVLENGWYKEYLELTDDQYRLLKWLCEEELLHEDYHYTVIDEEPKFKKI